MAEAAVIKNNGLGKIEGLCACYTKATLNGRSYNEIYQRILNGKDFRYNEMMRRGGIFCELGHPNQYTADFERTETDPQNACALITKIEEREHGKIYAEAVILDTPAGHIFKALQPFYKFGFSSRGSYEADEYSSEGPDGWNQDSYVFKGFDIVALPANEGSEISAVESLSSTKKRRPKFKSARESLDLQNIADAASVDPKEVDAELDKLFTKDGSLEPVELIDARDFAEGSKSASATTSKPTDESSLVLDLNKALTDKSDLEKKIQKALFEKAQSEAAMITLQKQVEDLTKLQKDMQQKIAFYEQNKQEIQELLDRLLATHDTEMSQSDAQLAEAQEENKSLAKRVSELEQKVEDATQEAQSLYGQAQKQEQAEQELEQANEQIRSLASSVESLKKRLKAEQTAREQAQSQLAAAQEQISVSDKRAASYRSVALAAKEELIRTYSVFYSVDPKALAERVGNSSDVKKIKSVAESISRDIVRASGYASTPVVSAVPAQKTTPFDVKDQVDQELLEALRKEGKAD